MKTKATFYMGRADCSVCVQADDAIVKHLDRSRYDVELVDLTADRRRVGEAEAKGVRTVPALVVDGQVFHINLGADLSQLK